MFERFSESSRRVILLARFEAIAAAASEIETEHVLLGLSRQDKPLLDRLLGAPTDAGEIRRQIAALEPAREERLAAAAKPSLTVNRWVLRGENDGSALSLSPECKRVLAFTANAAYNLDHKRVGTEHVLLGLLLEESSFAAEILRGLGLSIEQVRDDLAKESGF